jgi:hypothetical protein
VSGAPVPPISGSGRRKLAQELQNEKRRENRRFARPRIRNVGHWTTARLPDKLILLKKLHGKGREI